MVKTTNVLLEELSKYSQPINKIHRMMKEKKIHSIIPGIYETNRNVDPFCLAGVICSPSYISFDSALSYHGLIPEKVVSITSASFGKRKSHTYRNEYGRFEYQDVPKDAYPYGIILVEVDKNYSYQIATKEKALCDKLYKLHPIGNYDNLEATLFNSLRIDKDILLSFDLKLLELLSTKYHSSNITLLYKYLRRKAI